MQRRNFLLASAATIGFGLGLSRSVPLAAAAAPTTAEVIDDVTSEHPRLLVRDFAALRAKIDSSSVVRDWADRLVANARLELETAPQVHERPDGLRMTTTPVVQRAYLLSFAHRVTGEQAFADRLWAELDNAAGWPDWNASYQFLETAAMCQAFAIGLDWMWDVWSEEQRTRLATAMHALGLQPGIRQFADGAFWTKANHNWNPVCNGGLTMGALAVAQLYPETAAELIVKGTETIPQALPSYAPDGGYPEGTGYWSYGTGYLILYLASLLSASGTAYELDDAPGLDGTGYYPLDLTGPLGKTFNYYDNGPASGHQAGTFWLASRYQQPALTDWAFAGVGEAPGVLDVVLAEANDLEEPQPRRWEQRALDHHYQKIGVVTSRSSWLGTDPLFAGIKGGYNRTNHSDLDLGTIVLDALGVRWAMELGTDDYNLPGYFDSTVGGQRWTYYRRRTEGQNTMLFAPGADGGQTVTATATVARHESNSTGMITVVDLTPASPLLSQHRRGVRTLENRAQVEIRDEFSLTEATDAWWFWHTDCAITISDDGRTATLSQGEVRLVLRIVEQDLQFVHTPPRPLWTSPNPDGQNANGGISRLAIRLTDVVRGTVTVQASPLRPGDEVPALVAADPLDHWDLGVPADGLTGLTVDGTMLPGFRGDVHDYVVAVPRGARAGRVAGTCTKGRAIARQAVTVPGVATVQVHGGEGGQYRVRFVEDVDAGLQPGMPVVASSDDGNVPVNVLDGDLGTRWSASGDGEWIRLDLGEITTISQVTLAWASGNIRIAYFDLEVSDGGDWHQVFSGASSGKTLDPETFTFTGVPGRFVRYVGHGNSSNAWNSVTEFQVPDHPVAPPAVPLQLDRLETDLPTTLAVGSTHSISLQLIMNDGTTADPTGAVLEHVSSDPAVATVSAAGVVTPMAPGTVSISSLATIDHALRWVRTEIVVDDPNRRILTCVADAHVRGGTYADTNYGTNRSLEIKPDASLSYRREAYLQFDLTGINSLVSATLEFTGRTSEDATDAGVIILASTAIDEKTVTWNQRPALGETLGQLDLPKELAVHTLEVTDHVRSALAAGTVTFGLAGLVDDTHRNRFLSIQSREGGTPARLLVTIEP